MRGREDLGLADEVDAEVADDSHVPGTVSFADPGLVFFESHVEHPMESSVIPSFSLTTGNRSESA